MVIIGTSSYMKFYCNQFIGRDRWLELLLANPFSSPFQTPDFYDFYNAIPGYRAEAFAVETDGMFSALVVVTMQKEQGVKGFFSRRGIIYGGPLYDTSHPEALRFLFEKLAQLLDRELIYIEVRNFFDYSRVKDLYSMLGWKYEAYTNIQVLLKGKSHDQLLEAMKYNRKREIKLSQKEGASYCECPNIEDFNSLYNILSHLYFSRVKLPLPSYDFFLKFYHSNWGKVFVVKHQDRVIGGSFCPVLANRSIYTYYYCGLREYHKKIFPTHLAVIAAIDYGILNNLEFMDFMGAGKPDVSYGVREYKKEFGGELVEHGRFIRVTKPLLYWLGKTALKCAGKIK